MAKNLIYTDFSKSNKFNQKIAGVAVRHDSDNSVIINPETFGQINQTFQDEVADKKTQIISLIQEEDFQNETSPKDSAKQSSNKKKFIKSPTNEENVFKENTQFQNISLTQIQDNDSEQSIHENVLNIQESTAKFNPEFKDRIFKDQSSSKEILSSIKSVQTTKASTPQKLFLPKIFKTKIKQNLDNLNNPNKTQLPSPRNSLKAESVLQSDSESNSNSESNSDSDSEQSIAKENSRKFSKVQRALPEDPVNDAFQFQNFHSEIVLQNLLKENNMKLSLSQFEMAPISHLAAACLKISTNQQRISKATRHLKDALYGRSSRHDIIDGTFVCRIYTFQAHPK